MNKKDIKQSFQRLKPDDQTKDKMLATIKAYKRKDKQNLFSRLKRPIPAMLTLILLVAGGLFTYHLIGNQGFLGLAEHPNDDDFDVGIEDGLHKLQDEFQIDDRFYSILQESKQEEYGFPHEVDEDDIGDQLTTITTSIDADLLGKDVYHYVPAKSEAVVAVDEEDHYQLYEFYNFKSYQENQDEAASAYLELYGIEEAEDIAKVLLGRYAKSSKGNPPLNLLGEINDPKNIEMFYEFYSKLTNDSDQYFDRLFNGEEELPKIKKDNLSKNTEDHEPGEDTKEHSTPAYEGTAPQALENSVRIRIYQQSGLYYETIYYPNIKFISRHQVNQDFAAFLEQYIH